MLLKCDTKPLESRKNASISVIEMLSLNQGANTKLLPY